MSDGELREEKQSVSEGLDRDPPVRVGYTERKMRFLAVVLTTTGTSEFEFIANDYTDADRQACGAGQVISLRRVR